MVNVLFIFFRYCKLVSLLEDFFCRGSGFGSCVGYVRSVFRDRFS